MYIEKFCVIEDLRFVKYKNICGRGIELHTAAYLFRYQKAAVKSLFEEGNNDL